MKFMVLFLTIVSANAFASYHGEFQGKTTNEREIRWVWRHLPEFLVSCKASPTECQDPAVKASVDQLLAYIPAWDSPQQKAWAGLLQFVSEKDHGDLFKTGDSEAHRLAATALKKGSIVYINTDRMNLPLETWVGILAHESLHHLGVVDGPTRFPDVLAAEIARHFKKQMQLSTLEQFNLPNSRTLSFNSLAPGFGTVALFSNGARTSDIGWEPTPFQPVCSDNEKVFRQFASAPAWRLNRMRIPEGIVVIRGVGFVKTQCLNPQTQQQRTTTMPLAAAITLQYPKPLNLDSWMNQVPVPTYGDGGEDEFSPSMASNDGLFGQGQTFLIEAIKNEAPTVEAGGVWSTTITLKSLDGFVPDQCQLFVVGTQYSYIGQDKLPGVNNFDSCKLSNLGAGRWQVSGQTVMPASARPDLYYVPLVVLHRSSDQDERAAMPTIPTFVRVTNKNAQPPPKIRGITVLGLEPVQNLGSLKLTNSYMVKTNDSFNVEFLVEGPQKADDLWFDIDLWYQLPTEFGVARGTGSSISIPSVFRKTVITPVPNGTKVTMTFTMVPTLSGLNIAAYKFRKFYMRTSDFSWVEIEMPDLHDHFVINKRFFNCPISPENPCRDPENYARKPLR
jgi:hypothetical protein